MDNALHRARHERGRANPGERAAAEIHPRDAALRTGDGVPYGAERAGFGRAEVLPIADDLWRFCRLGA
jgi:hypothetical protein